MFDPGSYKSRTVTGRQLKAGDTLLYPTRKTIREIEWMDKTGDTIFMGGMDGAKVAIKITVEGSEEPFLVYPAAEFEIARG